MQQLITNALSPKKFFFASEKILPWLGVLFAIFFSYGTLGGLYLVPADYLQGDGFRILYVHAPCAFLSLFVYAVMAMAALVGIVWRIKLAFSILRQSAPLGAMFAFLALCTGSIWGKPMWGTWWIWDARLTAELILFFIYLAIILFQSSISHKRQGGRAVAILTLIGFIDIPIIHYSVYWWNTLHQGATLSLFSPPAIDRSMLYPLLAMLAAFLLYYSIVLLLRMRFELAIDNSHWLQE